MSRARDLSGMRFGYLEAVKSTGRKTKEGSGGCFIWECLCDCGKTCEVSLGNLTSGHTRSCGCLKVKSATTHGMTGTPTYRSWEKMLSRVRHESYAEWHGDVTVCERWDSYKGGTFANFLEDMGERPDGCTINRINGAKEYSKENCEWATLSVQSFDQKRGKHNTSGRTGVRWREDRGAWEANIGINNKSVRLYYGPSFEEACLAREKAEKELYGFTKE